MFFACISHAYGVEKRPNIVLVIGDGFGPQQFGLLAASSRAHGRPSTVLDWAESAHVSLVNTEVANAVVADSASAGSQLATGRSIRSEVLSLDANGEPLQTLLELANAKGYKTGVISDTRITHATPAAFYGHVGHRSKENELAVQASESSVDLMMSGGIRYFLPSTVGQASDSTKNLLEKSGQAYKSKRKDSRDLVDDMRHRGYDIAVSSSDLDTVSLPMIGLFANSAMHDAFRENLAGSYQPSLPRMTQRSLELLGDSDQPFMLVVEAGQIDWAGHNNDAGYLLAELWRLDRTMTVVRKFVDANPNTSVILTADHETGGFGFSYHTGITAEPYDSSSFDFVQAEVVRGLAGQRRSLIQVWQMFDELPEKQHNAANLQRLLLSALPNAPLTLPELQTVLDSPWQSIFHVYDMSHKSAMLGRLLSPWQNVVWASGTHTNTPVGAYIKLADDSPLPNSIVRQPDLGAWLRTLILD